MNSPIQTIERRTSADVVFDHLFEEIISLRMLPGTKISEADIAARFDISRQPVRDAFSRLGNRGLLLIRPQRATEVQKFVTAAIRRARFSRAALEMEVLGHAIKNIGSAHKDRFLADLDLQDQAVRDGDVDAFHKLDYNFHRLLCEAGGVPFAFDVIMENKSHVDRLCVLSMMDRNAMNPLVQDHRAIFDALVSGDINVAQAAMRTHLTRLDDTIASVQRSHPDYFI